MVVKNPWNDSMVAHPEQTGDADIDLVDERQVFVAFGVLGRLSRDLRVARPSPGRIPHFPTPFNPNKSIIAQLASPRNVSL
jgi:hypothetical protein